MTACEHDHSDLLAYGRGELDEATQRAVIRAILAEQQNQQGPESEMVAAIMATTMCEFLPSAVVKEVVAGG